MADESKIDPEIVKALEEAMRGGKITADQYAIAMDRLRKQAIDVVARLAELGKKGKEETDARKLSLKALKDEKEALERSSKSRSEKDAEWSLLQAKVMAGMEDATEEQKKAVAAQFKQTDALVKTEQRQKTFNESLATAKSYLLPLGQAAGDVAKSLAASINKDPLAAGADMATKYAEKAGQGLGAAGASARSAGESLMHMGKGGKIAGSLLQGAGLAAQGLGTAAKVAGEAMATIAPIMGDYQKSFTQAAAAGAAFGGGMSELRNISGTVGIKMGDLVGGIEKGAEAFQRGGMNFTQATKTVGQFGKGLVQGDEALELFGLGFTDVKERVALAGGAFDQARARGMGYVEAQNRISELTVQYGKDLKVLQGIAGKDAEKALEKARLETQRGALMSKLNDEQKNAYQGSFATLEALGPQADKARAALTQLASGGVITDPDILVNEPLKKMLEAMNAQVQAGSADVRSGAAESQKLLAQAAEEARGPAGELGRILDSAAVQLGKNADGVISGSAQMNNALLLYKGEVNQGAQQLAEVNKAAAAASTDATTGQFAKMNIAASQAQVALEQVATQAGAVKLFGEAMDAANKATMALVETINKVTGSGAGGAASSAASGLIDVISSKETWMVAASTIGLEIASKLGKIPLGGGSTIGSAVSGAAGGITQYLGSKAGSIVEAGKGMLTGAAGLAGGASEAVKAGAGGLAGSAGADLAKGFGGSLLKKIPLVGSAIAGGMEYMQSGKLGRSLAAGIGSGLGTVAGGLAGTAALPGVGTVAGGIAGGIGGEKAGTAIYDWLFGDDKPAEKPVEATPSDKVSQAPVVMNAEEQQKAVAAMVEQQRQSDPLVQQVAALVEAQTSSGKNPSDSMADLNGTMQQMLAAMSQQLELMRNVAANTKQTAMNVS